MAREHNTRDLSCWCDPDLFQVCPECEECDEPPLTCWRCQGRGLVKVFDRERPIIVVHNEATTRKGVMAMSERKRPVPGDVVIFHDPVGVPYSAICTADWRACINLVVVSKDTNKTDCYGRQIERHTSVSDKDNGVHGMYWRWPHEEPNPVVKPVST